MANRDGLDGFKEVDKIGEGASPKIRVLRKKMRIVFAFLMMLVLSLVCAESVVELTKDNFQEKLKEQKYWLIKFYSPRCGHCKNMAAAFEEAATNLLGEVSLGGVECPSNNEVCDQFKVRGYPTIKFFVDGKEVADYRGNRSVEDFMKFSREQKQAKEL